MNDYYEVRFNLKPCSEDATDFLAALLCDIGFESFVPDADGLTAYIKSEDFDEDGINNVLLDFSVAEELDWNFSLIPGQDWNAEWEKNYYQPIYVKSPNGDCVIHSSFHTDIPKAKFDIVIDPKMAFGTGHHATTTHMINALLELPLKGMSVIDMGTGTGILAILAAMRGAEKITAIEIDPCAYENAKENVSINNHPEINVVCGDASALEKAEHADLFIANINRNVILNDMPLYVAAIKPGGKLLLSGFYASDAKRLSEAAEKLGFKLVKMKVAEGGVEDVSDWTFLEFEKEI